MQGADPGTPGNRNRHLVFAFSLWSSVVMKLRQHPFNTVTTLQEIDLQYPTTSFVRFTPLVQRDFKALQPLVHLGS